MNITNIVDRVLKSWSALNIALEMDTSGRSKPNEEYQELLKNVSVEVENSYAYSHSNYQLAEYLYNLFEDTFNIVLEDDSHVQVAHVLLDLIHSLNHSKEVFESKFEQLPKPVINNYHKTSNPSSESEEGSDVSEESIDEELEEGWTKVQNNRK